MVRSSDDQILVSSQSTSAADRALLMKNVDSQLAGFYLSASAAASDSNGAVPMDSVVVDADSARSSNAKPVVVMGDSQLLPSPPLSDNEQSSRSSSGNGSTVKASRFVIKSIDTLPENLPPPTDVLPSPAVATLDDSFSSHRNKLANSVRKGINVVSTETRAPPADTLPSPLSAGDDVNRNVFNFFNGKKHFTVYKILVRYGQQKWTIFKRYSEFVELDKTLRKNYSYVYKNMSMLPPKKFFGDNLDPEFVQERARGLHQYVQSLFASPALLRITPVRDFLCGNRQLLSADEYTDSNAGSDHDSPSPVLGSRKPDVTFSTPSTFGQQTKSALKKRGGSIRRSLKKVAWRQTVFEVKNTGTGFSPSNSPSVSSASDSSLVDEIPKSSIGIDAFYLLKVIGKGNFGKVMLAQHKDNQQVYAIKVISKSSVKKRSPKKQNPKPAGGSPHDIDHIMAERNVLIRSVNHPFLIGLRWAFQSKEKLYFVTDYVNGGELFFHLQKEHRFSELRARFYAAEMVSALSYLHVNVDVVYRDLKPENILLDADGHIKLTDFGLAKENFHQENSGRTQTFCGTPEYLAPEVIRKEPYGFPVDWWCLGSVLYEMLIGLPPFYSKNTKEMYEKILHEKLKFPSYVGIRARSIISGLLHRSPYFRLGTGPNNTSNPDAVKDHPFFEGLDWNKLYRKEYNPPFVPVVSHTYDLRNIDPQFVNEPIPQSVIQDGILRQGGGNKFEVEVSEIEAMHRTPAGMTFKGFTFLGDDEYLTNAEQDFIAHLNQ